MKSSWVFRTWYYAMLTASEMTNVEVAKKIGINRVSLYNVLHGRVAIRKPVVISICWAFGRADKADVVWKAIKREEEECKKATKESVNSEGQKENRTPSLGAS